ncbi:MAG: DUF2911 domain-containing protein [Ignavibacteria bacterium]|nr:DUF2911 domain-containing protein [Ignavibacteria bacterium]
MFKKQLTIFAIITAFIFLGSRISEAQYLTPRPSPLQEVTQKVGVSDVTIVYSRPGVKDRVIWGELVPYNKMWRPGANENTTFEISDNAMIEGKEIPAGKYSFFTIPAENEWTVIINKKSDHFGTSGYDEANDVMRFTVKHAEDDFVERMRFDFEDLTDNSSTIVLRWEKLRIPFGIEFNTQEIVLSNIESLSAKQPDNWNIPLSGATYILSNDLDYQKGLTWAEASTNIEENYWNTRIKAQLLKKLGKDEEANAELAKAVVLVAKMENQPFDYERIKSLQDEWNK